MLYSEDWLCVLEEFRVVLDHETGMVIPIKVIAAITRLEHHMGCSFHNEIVNIFSHSILFGRELIENWCDSDIGEGINITFGVFTFMILNCFIFLIGGSPNKYTGLTSILWLENSDLPCLSFVLSPLENFHV